MVAARIQVLASALQGIPAEVDCIAAWSQGILISGYGCRWKALGSEIAHKIAPVYALFTIVRNHPYSLFEDRSAF